MSLKPSKWTSAIPQVEFQLMQSFCARKARCQMCSFFPSNHLRSLSLTGNDGIVFLWGKICAQPTALGLTPHEALLLLCSDGLIKSISADSQWSVKQQNLNNPKHHFYQNTKNRATKTKRAGAVRVLYSPSGAKKTNQEAEVHSAAIKGMELSKESNHYQKPLPYL